MATPSFVLVHGGAHGGWCYRRLAPALRARGYEVFTPTLTGYGERGHLESADLTMDDHALDVANVITYEDLTDVVLVGHSLGGVTIPVAAERVPDRIRRVVWYAGPVLADGESIMTHYLATSDAVRHATETMAPEDFAEAFMQDGTPDDKAWVASRLGPTSMASVTHAGDLTRFLALGLPTGYIACLQDQAILIEDARRFHTRLPGARYAEVDAGHNSMLTQPEATADALEAMAAD
jgi:pimeloyl-ACP methyl ester carboxylesterase